MCVCVCDRVLLNANYRSLLPQHETKIEEEKNWKTFKSNK